MPSKFVSCPLCGQGFGSASISIHIPQCYDKALKRWQLDPRGPKPVMPSRSLSTGTSQGVGASSMPSYNGSVGPAPVRTALNQRQQQLLIADAALPTDNPNLHPCRKCGRSFAFDRIAYHEGVCKGNKKRKPFNSKKQRLSEFDEYEVNAAGRGGGRSSVRGRGRGGRGGDLDSRPSGSTSWRRQHADFISAIRSAKVHQQQVSVLQAQHPMQRGADNTGRRQPRQPFASNALRHPDTYRTTAARAAAGTSGALGPRQVPKFPGNDDGPTRNPPRSTPAGSGRGAVSAVRSNNAFGGPSNVGAYSGGAPSYRIANTNQTSTAMLQALGRL
jgi:hypothetical protein